jgi:hypothetical protein
MSTSLPEIHRAAEMAALNLPNRPLKPRSSPPKAIKPQFRRS